MTDRLRGIRVTKREALIAGVSFAVGTVIAASIPRGLGGGLIQESHILSPRSRHGVRIEVASSISDFAPVPGTTATLLFLNQELPTHYNGDSPVDPPSSGIRFIAAKAQNGDIVPAFAIDIEGRDTPEIWRQKDLKEPVVRVIEPNGKAGQWRQLRYEADNRSQPAGIVLVRMQLIDQAVTLSKAN